MLIFWFLDPLILKSDLSEILQETMNRPFLFLRKEFHERTVWRSILICLVLSPAMFNEARALLHDWFLSTGLSSVLQFLIDLVSAVLDAICRPRRWGISAELGSKLPFTSAYFPLNNCWLRYLAGPISCDTLLRLVNGTRDLAGSPGKQLGHAVKPSATKIALLDNTSLWSVAINFPDWFSFASVLLFTDKSFLQATGVEVHANAAASYLGWILSPTDENHRDILSRNLIKLSQHWTMKQVSAGAQENKTIGLRKRVKKPKLECGHQAICLWLKEYQKMIYCIHESVPDAPLPEHNMFFR
ncbi:hypothetical protein LINGRAHAP2_LOCUS2434 [Linum grandiflorum]